MKPKEIFEFEARQYEARIRTLDTRYLQEQEIIKIRQTKKAAADVGAGTLEAALTGGASVIKPIYAARQGEVAEAKLRILQAELAKRGVALHTPDDADNDAAALAVVTGEFGSQAIDAGLPDTIGSSAAECVEVEMVSGEITSDSVAEITDKLPEKICSRKNLKPYHQLRCDLCRSYFDTSFTEYLRMHLHLLNWFKTTHITDWR